MRSDVSGFALLPSQLEMLEELNSYLDDNFPREHEGGSGSTTPEWSEDKEFEWIRDFNRRLAQDGWLVPHWPERFGGRGLSAIDYVAIRELLAYRRVPIANANGLDMLAPILLELGTPEQQDAHLSRIAQMDEMWCQGFSEPDAGSDLTSLRTTAQRDGDYYIINGSKIWTGHAMHADWMVLLARTDLESTDSKGLSLLMVDMKDTPGITVHPIRSATGRVTFCQEFFSDARVPAANLVGPEHEGWRASRVLLGHERQRVGNAAASFRRLLDDLFEVVAARGGADRNQAAKLGAMLERVECARSMAREVASAASAEKDLIAHMPSVMKIYGSGLGHDLTTLACEILGLDVCDYEVEGSWDYWNEFLIALVTSIGGGTSEIQHEIIGARYFGLARS